MDALALGAECSRSPRGASVGRFCAFPCRWPNGSLNVAMRPQTGPFGVRLRACPGCLHPASRDLNVFDDAVEMDRTDPEEPCARPLRHRARQVTPAPTPASCVPSRTRRVQSSYSSWYRTHDCVKARASSSALPGGAVPGHSPVVRAARGTAGMEEGPSATAAISRSGDGYTRRGRSDSGIASNRRRR